MTNKTIANKLKSIMVLLLIGQLAMATQAFAASDIVKTEKVSFALERVTQGLGIPWGLAFISDSEILITERDGAIKLLDLKTRDTRTISGAPEVKAEGQGGMLDVAVPPDFKTGDWIYFTFVRDILSEGVTVLARAKLNGNKLEQWQDLLETESASGSGRHYGSRIAFDNDGHVYFGVGDRGERPNGQDLTNHASTVIRLHRDGRIPGDNPFINDSKALNEIWSYGHRNPQGMAYDAANERLWLIEHGPRGGDEINLVQKGLNYGWPVISYGKEYWGPFDVGESTHKPGMEQPVKQFTPSIAPGSLMLYTGDAFPEWQGNLFSGALKLTHLNRVTLGKDKQGKLIATGEEKILDDMQERIRALAQAPNGWIYFSTDSGMIFVIKPPQ